MASQSSLNMSFMDFCGVSNKIIQRLLILPQNYLKDRLEK